MISMNFGFVERSGAFLADYNFAPPRNVKVSLVYSCPNKLRAEEFRSRLADFGFEISALSCHGNPVHPDAAIANRDDTLLRRTIELAERLRVQVVVAFSGCPGGSAQDRTPNWITTAWPPELADALEWQWEQRLVPYWQKVAQLASDSGVRVALEAHPGFAVYNPETLLRLRAAVGSAVGINLDPSHLWWQGIDIPRAIAALGDSVFHVHIKDMTIDSANTACSGVLDTKSYRRVANVRGYSAASVGDTQSWSGNRSFRLFGGSATTMC